MTQSRPMPPVHIESISAVTLATRDMARAAAFYDALGFTIVYGGPAAPFTTLCCGGQRLNLIAHTGAGPFEFWGRIIFHVSDVDAFYRRVTALGYETEAPPQDAPWGERFFHMHDPDRHPLSFARPLG